MPNPTGKNKQKPPDTKGITLFIVFIVAAVGLSLSIGLLFVIILVCTNCVITETIGIIIPGNGCDIGVSIILSPPKNPFTCIISLETFCIVVTSVPLKNPAKSFQVVAPNLDNTSIT